MRERILRIRTDEIYRLVQAVLLVCIVLAGAGEWLGIREWGTVHVVTACAAPVSMSVMQRMTGRGRAVALLCPAAVVCMVFGIRNCFLFIQSYAGWLTGAYTWEPAWTTGYEAMQIAAVSACCYLLQCILEKYLLLKIVMLCLLVCALLYCMITGQPVHHAAVVCSLSYIMAVGAEWTEWGWDKERKKNRKAYMFWLMPFMAVYLFIMLWLPAPSHPFRWQFARDAFRQVKESVTMLAQHIMHGGTESFDTALSGFSEDGTIRGDLEADHRPVMVVQGEKNLTGNIYLAGRAYDAFDGRQWYRRDAGTVNETFLDTIRTRYAGEVFEGNFLHDSMAVTTLRIRYEYFNSAYIFVPLKTQRVMEGNKDLPFVPAGGSLLFADAERRGYGTEYEVVFYQLNAGSGVFEEFLTSMYREEMRADAVMKSILRARTERTGVSITEEDVGAYNRQVEYIYAEAPVLSDAVRAYLDEITGDAQNDIEKLRMIEAELAAYTYTRAPGKLPDRVEDAGGFLEYFLLESREGYCTHFATAFALLARAEGLPSRYVQGFCVPVANGTETVVYSDMAHAWPEVYLDGIGWIPFEPTPGYGRLRYTPWETEWKYEPSYVMAGEYYANYGADEEADGTSGTEESPPENTAADGKRFEYGLKIAGYTLLMSAASGLLFAVAGRLVRKKRYQRMDPSGRFDKAVRDNMRLLAWLGLRRGETETLQEFAGRAAARLGLTEGQTAFIGTYEALLYGEKRVDEADVRAAGEAGRQLLAVLKEKKKRFYFYYRVRVYWNT